MVALLYSSCLVDHLAISFTIYAICILQSIEKELLERLSKGVYGDIYNVPEQKYQEILAREAEEVASEEEDEEVLFKSFMIFCQHSLFS